MKTKSIYQVIISYNYKIKENKRFDSFTEANDYINKYPLFDENMKNITECSIIKYQN